MNFRNFHCEILAFGEFPNNIVVHFDLQATIEDVDGSEDFGGLQIPFQSYSVVEIFQAALVKVDGAVVFRFVCLHRVSQKNVEACHRFDGSVYDWRLVCGIDSQSFDPSTQTSGFVGLRYFSELVRRAGELLRI